MNNRNGRGAVGVVAVMMCALTVAAVGCTRKNVSSTSNSDVAVTTSSPNSRVSAPVSDLLVRRSDFPSIGDNQYSQDDSGQGYTPVRSGPIDACDRLMWPAKEYPDLVHRSAFYDPLPERGGQSMAVTVFTRELPAQGVDFDRTLRNCSSFETPLTEYGNGHGNKPFGTATKRTTLTAIDVPGVDGQGHGYKFSELNVSSVGTASMSPDEYRLVGTLRGITFVVSLFDWSDIGAAAVDRDLARLFNNQRQRILDAP